MIILQCINTHKLSQSLESESNLVDFLVNCFFLNLFMNQSLFHLNSDWGVYIEWITLELPITRTHRDSTVRGCVLDLSINLGALSPEPVLNSTKVRIYSVFQKWTVPGQNDPPCCSEWKLQLHWTKILSSSAFVSTGVLRGWCSVRNCKITPWCLEKSTARDTTPL